MSLAILLSFLSAPALAQDAPADTESTEAAEAEAVDK